MQTLDPRSKCIALIYKVLIDGKVILKDCFDCANGKSDSQCEKIQFI